MHQLLQIPGGMQDTLPAECQAKRKLEYRLRELFRSWGYSEIETPVLEYYETLSDETWGYRPEHVWKTFDRDGRILAIRPETTMPSARLAAGRLRDVPLPLRLCYLQNGCLYEKDTLSMLSERPQAGVELMGEAGPEADAEAIYLAVETLRSCGISSFQMELGQAAFFSAFMEEAGLEGEEGSLIRSLIDEKNALGIQLALKKHGEELAGKIMQLPRLYGGEEVIEKALKLTSHPRCLRALENLRDVIRMLRDFGYGDEIFLDLGMAQEAGYYSGTVFRFQTPGVGQVLLSGGRYDGLPGRFGRDVPAVGFAINLKLCLIALERQGTVFQEPVPDLEIGFAPGRLRQASEAARQARLEGLSVSLVYDAEKIAMEERKKRGLCRDFRYVE